MTKFESYEAALLDPASCFVEPEDVLREDRLTPDQKVEILRRWEYDASAAAVAEEEGMATGEPSLVRRILLALNLLVGTVDVEGTPPTKQGGIPKNRL